MIFKHVRREHNSCADELCNLALDGKWEPSPESLVAAARAATARPLRVPRPSLDGEAPRAAAPVRGAQPSAEAVWEQLSALLTRHGVALPRGR